MRVLNQMYPTADQLGALLQSPVDAPIAMVNLLRFHERAQYPEGTPDSEVSGREAYMRYAAAMQPIVEGSGGRFVFSGDVGSIAIGEVEDMWDAVGIVEYPSPAAFHAIATSPEVQAIMGHRHAGLAGQLLLMAIAHDPQPGDAAKR